MMVIEKIRRHVEYMFLNAFNGSHFSKPGSSGIGLEFDVALSMSAMLVFRITFWVGLAVSVITVKLKQEH